MKIAFIAKSSFEQYYGNSLFIKCCVVVWGICCMSCWGKIFFFNICSIKFVWGGKRFLMGGGGGGGAGGFFGKKKKKEFFFVFFFF